MKTKSISFILIITIVLSITSVVQAKNGDIIGYTNYTDISAYVNHYPITSYNIKGRTCVVAEDLQNYGFDVEWNGINRSLSIKRSNSNTITPCSNIYKCSKRAGTSAYPYLETDIKTYVNNIQIPSYNIGGKTVVYMDDLATFGEIVWVPDIRAIKMWISDLPVAEYQEIPEEPVINYGLLSETLKSMVEILLEHPKCEYNTWYLGACFYYDGDSGIYYGFPQYNIYTKYTSCTSMILPNDKLFPQMKTKMTKQEFEEMIGQRTDYEVEYGYTEVQETDYEVVYDYTEVQELEFISGFYGFLVECNKNGIVGRDGRTLVIYNPHWN